MPEGPIKRLCAIVAAVSMVGVLSGFTIGVERLFLPAAEAWPRWEAFDGASVETIDHAPWDRFLAEHVSPDEAGINRVAYGRVGSTERAQLDAYLDGLAGVAVGRLNRAEQRALWINLYNALTVRVVLDHYPVESIRDIRISPGLMTVGPWDLALIEVDGQALTLNDIEHRILRPIWRDARLHYALNCASVGCPNLGLQAYTGTNGEALLAAAAKDFVNSRRGAHVGETGLVVSKIYGWFREDFGGTEEAVIDHLRAYAAPPLTGDLAGADGIAGYAYDWRLNDDTP